MEDSKDKKIPEVPHLENVTGDEKIPVSADGSPAYIEVGQIYDKDVTPYPKANEIVYTTIDGEAIEIADANLVSNVYYKDKGFGVITFNSKITKLDLESSLDKVQNVRKVILSEGFTSVRFKHWKSLEEVELPSTANTLGQGCFENTKLRQIILPEGITSIPDYCFADCHNLVCVTSLGDITTINPRGFVNCYNLISFNALTSGTVTVFGNASFMNCYNLRVNLRIPDKAVLMNNCFQNSGILGITFENNYDLNGDSIFSSCYNLQYIWHKISNKVRLNSRLYQLCYSLRSFSIDDGTSEIPIACFELLNLDYLKVPISVTEFGAYAFNGTTVRFLDWGPSIIPQLTLIPLVDKLETLILRSPTLVEDVDTYVSTFTLEEGQKLPQGAMLLPKPKAAPMASTDGGIMPLTNLDQYIGTPNNWLKIYVPANLLKAYQERYPTLKGHFHPITGEDIYAMRDEVQGKLKGLYVSDIKQNGGTITITFKSYYDGVESTKNIDFKTLSSKSLFGQGDIKLSDLNEFDVLNTTVDALDRRMGEVNNLLDEIQRRLDSLQS